jgi:undecaprenyl-diphosphatase
LNDYLAAVVLGIVEGLTEFLPVSSTAHIRIAQKLLQQDFADSYWKMFAVVIQLGAILSVIVYFQARLLRFVRSFPKGDGTRTAWNHPLSLVALSFLVTAIPCFLIDETIGERLENLNIMGWALILGGLAMWCVDRWCVSYGHTDSIEKMTLTQAIGVGLFQILSAAFPGTSRSMSTIAGGQLMGMSRPAALEFSFFLSIPVMMAATGFKIVQFLLADSPPEATHSLHQWSVLGVGFAVSFATALAVIAWLMHWVRKHGFVPFAIYRLLAGVAVLVWLA